MEGFQLWLNLPAKDKMRAPWYRDFNGADVPAYTTADGVAVKVIAGSSHGVAGAVQREVTEPIYLDIHLPAGASFSQLVPEGHNAFLFTYRGAVKVGDKDVASGRMAILANTPGADGVTVHAAEASRLILIAGQPLNEPIAQYGAVRDEHAGGNLRRRRGLPRRQAGRGSTRLSFTTAPGA